ncbi:MAG: amidohydrolase family protein, partial [Gammaproteobacteria bacterium]|nr:amidohydrolase family protein [Gammaproteobacteria bacterium]
AAIHRDFMPADLAPLLQAYGVTGTVLVQAADCAEETVFMQRADAEFVRGIVGWVDFDAADAPVRVEKLAAAEKIVGVRPMIQDIADPGWMLRPALRRVFRAVAEAQLVFDALVKPPHLDNLHHLLERHPDLRVVVDHGGKPCIRAGANGAGGLREWAPKMRRLAGHPQAMCKFSGLLTEAEPGAEAADLQPYADVLLETFGGGRLLWGSDWPVVCLAGGYGHWLEVSRRLLAALPAAEQRGIWKENAERQYNLPRHQPPA